jgi:hypothetical protein
MVRRIADATLVLLIIGFMVVTFMLLSAVVVVDCVFNWAERCTTMGENIRGWLSEMMTLLVALIVRGNGPRPPDKPPD